MWDQERSAGDIAARFDVSWPAVSQNLRILREAGLISERRDGTKRFYRAEPDALGPLALALTQMWESDLGAVEAAMERERRG